MNCKYSIRDSKFINGRQYLLCNLSSSKDEICPLTYYCPNVNRIINTKGYDKNCTLYKRAEENIGRTDMENNRVLFEKRGKLYVELNDELGQVIMVDNIYGSDFPKFVKLLKRKNGEYYIKKPNEETRN